MRILPLPYENWELGIKIGYCRNRPVLWEPHLKFVVLLHTVLLSGNALWALTNGTRRL